jgi:hypothetical protein
MAKIWGRPSTRAGPRLYANDQPNWRDLFIDPELKVRRRPFRIKICSKESVPNGKYYAKIAFVMLWLVAVVYLVIPWRHDYPFQPSIAPSHVEMHEVVLNQVFCRKRPNHPRWNYAEKKPSENVGKI